MGNREDLLAGAKRCLVEKGYQRTSARDIATAAGTSLAAIGYHFGGKDNLLNLALVESAKEWGDEVERALAFEVDPGLSPVERFEETWRRVIESFTAQRGMWLAQFRLLAELRELPDAGEFLVSALREGRRELAAIFQPSAGDKRVVGSVYHALLLGVMAQWLIDPEDALSSTDLVSGLRSVSALFEAD